MSFEGDKMKARITVLLSALAMTVIFTACNDNDSSIPEYQDPEKVVISDRIPYYPTETGTAAESYELIPDEQISDTDK